MNGKDKRQVPVSVAILTFFGMLAGIALFFSIDTRAWAFVWLFPAGLCALFGTPIHPIIGVPLLILSYAIYFVIFAAFIKARTWRRFSVLCIVFACVLLLNVAGYGRVLEEFSHIQ